MDKTTFKAVTRGNPCELCDGDHKCSVGKDGLRLCGRCRGEVAGFVYLGQAKGDDQFGMYRPIGDPLLEDKDRQTYHRPNGRPFSGTAKGSTNGTSHTDAPTISWEERVNYYAAAMTERHAAVIAERLGLPVSVLPSLRVGYMPQGPHMDPSTQRPIGPCYTFPEADGTGQYLGITCRYGNGQKLAFPGGKRGLAIPIGWEDRDGPVFLPEGPSDTLALTAMNLAALGRPNNTSGIDMLVERLKNVPLARLIVVVAEFDPKATGRWPGKEGAEKTAAELAAKLGRPVQWALPPEGNKDVRTWFVAQGTDLNCADSLNELGEKLRGILESQLLGPGKAETTASSGYRFAVVDSPTFAAADYRMTWYVKRLIVKGQPAIVGGPKKTLKTSIIIDLVISLGTGTPFLGTFTTYQAVRVAMLSGESGEFVTQETAKRICAARGIDLATANVDWGFTLPQLSRPEDLVALQAGLVERKIEVLIIDPAYLCLLAGGGANGARAENMLEMGPLLLAVTQTCLKVGVTPILIHHAKKFLKCEPMELDDLAYSGFAEFARQWVLLSRQKPYDPANPGVHNLWLNVGGSAGQGGLWSVDIEEGTIRDDFSGRKWEVAVSTATEARQTERSEKEQQRSERDRKKDLADDAKLLEVIKASEAEFPDGIVYTQARALAKLSGDRMTRSVSRLKAEGAVEDVTVEIFTGTNKKVKRPVQGLRRKGNPTVGTVGTNGELPIQSQQ